VAKGETFQREKLVFVDIPETAEDMIRTEPPAEPEVAPKPEPAPEPEPVVEPAPEPEPAPVLEEEVIIEEPPTEEETVSLAMIFGVFIGLNVLIGLGIGAFFLIRNRRRSKQAGKAKDAVAASEETPEKADE
jgi:outer membrane biosynthesis protein TonB